MNDHTRIACPQCAALNRVPSVRLGDGPVCGRCKAALFTGAPVELSAATFDRHVLESDVPVVVDFWAPWCGPCLSMAPTFAAAAAKLEPGVRLVKVNTEAHPALASRYGIRSIPTLAVFRNGQEVTRQSGALPMNALLQFVQRSAGTAAA